tara:strand:- start:2802 stop:2996 length:195 start_codon:yes stop_codon:yes gene_type:complete
MLPKNIYPCSRHLCKCIEYLDLSKQVNINRYTNCYNLALKNRGTGKLSDWEYIIRDILIKQDIN